MHRSPNLGTDPLQSMCPEHQTPKDSQAIFFSEVVEEVAPKDEVVERGFLMDPCACCGYHRSAGINADGVSFFGSPLNNSRKRGCIGGNFRKIPYMETILLVEPAPISGLEQLHVQLVMAAAKAFLVDIVFGDDPVAHAGEAAFLPVEGEVIAVLGVGESVACFEEAASFSKGWNFSMLLYHSQQ